MKNFILIAVLTSILSSCSAYIKSDFSRRFTSLSTNDSIKILFPKVYLHRNNSKDLKIGSIIVGDHGITKNCDSITMINIVKDSARANGGNLIGIVRHQKPSFWSSTCHQFYAHILKENVVSLDTLSTKKYVTLAEKIKIANTYPKLSLIYNNTFLFRTVSTDYSSEFDKNIKKQLKKGYGTSIAAYYNFKKNGGYGLKYGYMNYTATYRNAYTTFNDGRPRETGTYKAQSQVHYFALSSHSNFDFGNTKKNTITLGSSVGYTQYTEHNGILTQVKTTGNSIGFELNTGYLRKLSPKFSLGIHLGLFQVTYHHLQLKMVFFNKL